MNTEDWRNFDPTMGIKCEQKDMKKIATWAKQFHHRLQILWDNGCSSNEVAILPATTGNLKELLAKIESRQAPTLLYLSGHTEVIGQEHIYLTLDSLQQGGISSDMALRYSEMGRQLVSRGSSKPLIWVTEIDECDNFTELPYVYRCEAGQVKCEKTGFKWPWGKAQALHFAATSPNQRAITFEGSSGAIYTSALQRVTLGQDLSLGEIALNIQLTMDELLECARCPETQQHRIYSSHRFDQDDLFTALGFTLRPSSCQMA
ncbi:unnamed protein product [Rhizoctonia solani]|uniref:Uncharacterized protein n=1 Tax=Rhizoctonia solani TaxID=456999 RepID=A0A8H3AQW9_9AGAM|nr:unnamed protein product [Rhizoctonia solani]